MILFDTNEKNFITNGLGRLTDAIACTVTEERNGSFELALTYPITGRKYKELILLYGNPCKALRRGGFAAISHI